MPISLVLVPEQLRMQAEMAILSLALVVCATGKSCQDLLCQILGVYNTEITVRFADTDTRDGEFTWSLEFCPQSCQCGLYFFGNRLRDIEQPQVLQG